MVPTTLLCGKKGLLGRALQPWLPPQAISTDRLALDFSHLENLRTYLHQHRPQVLINAVGYTQVDAAQSPPQTALCDLINHQAVTVLADYARQSGALLIHFSSDYVFDGQSDRPYTETDSPAPLNMYGLSKYQAEQVIINSQCRHLIFRLSWLYGDGGKSFVRTIMQRALTATPASPPLSVVNDQIGTPTPVWWVAPIIFSAIQAHQEQKLPSGLYHLSPAGQGSWYELAVYIVQQLHQLNLKNDFLPLPSWIQPTDQAHYVLPARRPAYSVLDNSLLQQFMPFERPHWQALLSSHLAKTKHSLST